MSKSCVRNKTHSLDVFLTVIGSNVFVACWSSCCFTNLEAECSNSGDGRKGIEHVPADVCICDLE